MRGCQVPVAALRQDAPVDRDHFRGALLPGKICGHPTPSALAHLGDWHRTNLDDCAREARRIVGDPQPAADALDLFPWSADARNHRCAVSKRFGHDYREILGERWHDDDVSPLEHTLFFLTAKIARHR